MKLLLAAILAVLNIPGHVTFSQVKQHLSGNVYRESGNRMPAHNRGKITPKLLQTELYIYAAATANDAEGTSPNFTSIKTRLVATVITDAAGHYTIDLEPGKYSVFIKTGDVFYADETDMSGTLNPVEITADKPVHRDFFLRRGAVY